MAGQFLSKHVAVKQVEGKTLLPQSIVTAEDLRGRNVLPLDHVLAVVYVIESQRSMTVQ